MKTNALLCTPNWLLVLNLVRTAIEATRTYSEFVSIGWDYTVRFSAQPFSGNSTDTNPILISLDIRQTIPICLNSILCRTLLHLNFIVIDQISLIDKSHLDLADLYIASGNNSSVLVDSHRSIAASLKAGILDLFWDSSKVAFYDYNLTSNARNTIYTTATFYPLWSGIIPDEILMDASKAFGFFAGINLVLNRYNGTFPTTFITTGLQWYVKPIHHTVSHRFWVGTLRTPGHLINISPLLLYGLFRVT